MKCKLFSLLLLFFLFFSPSIFGRSSKSEEEDLLAIKAGLIDPSGSLVDWMPPRSDGGFDPHCNWTGVQCDRRGHVEGLKLSRKQLAGQLSPAILRLRHLAHLDVSHNFLVSLPDDLSALRSLRSLDVSDNSLRGRLPAGLGASPWLRVINASANDLSKMLPEDLGNATALEILDLRGGYLSGPIPASFGGLIGLQFLGLSGNELTGKLPTELGRLTSLETMILGYNQFDGPIPHELGLLRNLRYLDVAVAGITGPIPKEMGNITSLEVAYLFGNRISDQLPREIGNLKLLKSLDLSNNELTGTIPREVTLLTNLQLLNLMCNGLKGRVPSGLAKLKRLEILGLWNNSLSGPLPKSLGRNSPLRWLDVSTNNLSATIPRLLCARGRLERLILFENGFSGPIPSGLAKCGSLVRVRLHENRLNGSIPTGFGRLPRLDRLEISGNELTGPVPDDLPESRSLSFVDLSRNRLRFALPPGVFSVPTLQTFAAAGNAIGGGVSGVFGPCPSLTVLDLSANSISGSIPGLEIWACQRLVRLNLSSNLFTGEIPVAIADLPMLSVLDVSYNRVSGPVPVRLGGSPALESLNLSYNRLSGPVPVEGLLKAIDPRDLEGNPFLCGGVLGECVVSGSVGHSHKQVVGVVVKWVVGVFGVVLVGVLVLGSTWVCRRRWVGVREGGGGGKEWPWKVVAFQKVGFTGAEVAKGVEKGEVVGMGATGVVYKVELPRHRTIVAVKKLWVSGGRGSSYAVEDDLAREVTLLGRLRHRNIISVVGLVRNDLDVMIVYEFMEKGNLWEALHDNGDNKRGPLVDWAARYNIATGVAAGLAYLHHDCRPPVVHRDLKSGNILLDGSGEAKIADFGFAKTTPVGIKGESIAPMLVGSYGYIAPECAYMVKVDEKSDVYSFGVVLMELLTGRKPIDPEFGEAGDLISWVRRRLGPGSGGKPEDILTDGRYQHEMIPVLRIALLCTASSPKDRPSMRDVVAMLAEAKPRRKSSGSGNGGGRVVKSMVMREEAVFTPAPSQ